MRPAPVRHEPLTTAAIVWPSRTDWSQAMPNGDCWVGDVLLPPLPGLQRLASAIAAGMLTGQRGVTWQDMKDWPGDLQLRADLTGGPSWWISFREAGDPDSRGWSGSHIQPNFALAWMIAVAWEHHQEQLTERVLETGAGLA